MNGFQYDFDATQYQPIQSVGGHPEGKFLATISNTELKPIKDDADGRPIFNVEFTTDAGKITRGYNLFSAKENVARISLGQLSALSHATGIYRVQMQNEGAALRGARCMIEVAKQKNDSGYVEVKTVFDVNGNEPGKPMQPQQQPNATGPVSSAPASTGPSPWGSQPPPAQAPTPQPTAAQASPWQQQAPTPQPTAAQASPWQQQAPAGAPPWQQR